MYHGYNSTMGTKVQKIQIYHKYIHKHAIRMCHKLKCAMSTNLP